MNRKAAYIIIGLFSMLLLFNCKKEKTDNNPPVQGGIGLKIKILEFGSEIPLSNVKLTVKICQESGKYGCATFKEIKSWTSGVDGTITIPIYEYPSQDVFETEEANHWTKSETYIFDTVIQKSGYDSAVIRLYPLASITFHFKNVNNYSAKERIRTYMEASPNNKTPFSIESPIIDSHIANNFDTVFTYKTYGNVGNRLVCELLDSNFVFIKKLIDETKLIPKSAMQEWNVNY